MVCAALVLRPYLRRGVQLASDGAEAVGVEHGGAVGRLPHVLGAGDLAKKLGGLRRPGAPRFRFLLLIGSILMLRSSLHLQETKWEGEGEGGAELTGILGES